MKLTENWKLIPRSVRGEMPHVPTEEMIRYHEWYLYRTFMPDGSKGLWLVYTGTHEDCCNWMRRNRPDGILADEVAA